MKELFTLTILLIANYGISQIISEKLVKKHLYTLSNDNMGGRKAGTLGIEKAAKYIESEFKRIGLEKFDGLDSYRQNFTDRDLSLFNIIGCIKGNEKRDEFVIISAHYDHLGTKNNLEGDKIFNGANDNASGVTAVLALAEFFSKNKINSRSILFIAFTAEEMGLLGSKYFGKQINPEKIVAGINIEMIGKESPFGPKTAWITGFDRSSFGQIIQKNLTNSEYKVFPDPYIAFRLFYRSDNAALARLGIPAHTFSTSPMDKDLDYHKVTDEAKTLDPYTIKETIKAIAEGTLSIIIGKDTPSRVKIIKY
ncbi:MAG: peptidase M28 [Flavobacteriaceae bacterium]|nr:peptidase M28 [Flavobacteriaceae bacterium]|tara:strand:+ start:1452 stop:2378 length:927 start_codon:yes stop_codon:yes gene_type:complete